MKNTRFSQRIGFVAVLGMAVAVGTPKDADAFAYIFAGEANGVDVVTHSMGYTGTGGNLVVSVGIDPTSTFSAQMVIPTENVVNTWNGKLPTTGNVNGSGIGGGQPDFESTLLHEMGHALGLGHPNAGSESGLAGNDRNYTRATKGANDTFDLDPGPDGIIGSGDDIRGDDANLNYFRIADNNPFATDLGVVDSTTYSRDISLLPGTDTYSANPDRAVANALGFVNTEAVLQQGTFAGETQRTLGADDVAGLLYAQSGLDGIAGTADDYIVTLDFLGLTSSADVVIDFDNSETGFAETQSSGIFLSPDHAVVTSSSIFFNSSPAWFFNQVSNVEVAVAVNAPGGLALFAAALAFLGYRRRGAAA